MPVDADTLARTNDPDSAVTLLMYGLLGRQRRASAALRKVMEGKAAHDPELASLKREALDQVLAMQAEVNALVSQVELIDIAPRTEAAA